MADKIAVDTRQLSGTAETLSELLENIKTELKELYDAVEVMNGMWDGPANASFCSQFAQDQQAAYALCDVLRQYMQSMEYAGSAYDSCEKKVMEKIASVQL